VSAPTPLLDFFKRGEVAREVRLLAAAGALAPRAHEQLSILILLLDDSDREVRESAQATLDRGAGRIADPRFWRGRMSRSACVSFSRDRGVFPAEIPALSADDPLLDTEAGEGEAPEPEAEDQSRDSLIQQLANMSFTDRLKAAMKGSREMRAILIRDPNKMIAAAVLSSPKLNDAEIEGFSTDGERVRGSAPGHQRQSRLDQELQRRRRSHQEPQNAGRPLAQSDGAAERS
jgi:hypothetical protein